MITIDQGRSAFAKALEKYRFDDASMEILKDYYGYFWNRAKYHDIPKIQANILLYCRSKAVGAAVKNEIESFLRRYGLLSSETIGYSFMGTPEDTNEIVELYSEAAKQEVQHQKKKDQFASVIIAVPEEKAEFDAEKALLDAGTQLFFREFHYHLHTALTEAEFLCCRVCEKLEEQRTCSEEFKTGLAAYIEYVAPQRELTDDDAFVQDAADRVFRKYQGKYDWSQGIPIPEDCVPDYKGAGPVPEPEQKKGPEDITDAELENAGINHVLLLNMSTLPKRGIEKSVFTYDDNEASTVEAYGQLEPVPQMLQTKLRKNGENLDLIIITASEECMKPKTVSVKREQENGLIEPEEIKSTEVDFFKTQIIAEFNRINNNEEDIDQGTNSEEGTTPSVKFRVINIEKEETAIKETTELIRKIKGKSGENFRLYMDIHGGLRDAQLLHDAIVNTLSIEGIEVKEAYTCTVGKSQKIIDVTEKLRVFDFVSGMNEFIHYGSGKGLANYLKGENDALVQGIQSVSEKLSLCNIEKLEDALDDLADAIEAEHDQEDDLISIFIENIKADYGDLLDCENRTLYSIVEWAKRKSFYQQALAIIEAKTPGYVFDTFWDAEQAKICDGREYATLRELEDSDKGKIYKDDNEAVSSALFRSAFFSRRCFWWNPSAQRSEMQMWKGSELLYTVVVPLKREFQDKEAEKALQEKIRNLGNAWMKLKRIRNKVFHVADVTGHQIGGSRSGGEEINVQSVDRIIGEYLTYLKAVMESPLPEEEIESL